MSMCGDYVIDFKSLPVEIQEEILEIYADWKRRSERTNDFGHDQWQMGYLEGECDALTYLFGEEVFNKK